MDEFTAKELVAGSGLLLLEKGLVARTWGNISCRIDGDWIAITPSGLAYEEMKAEDIAILNIRTEEWIGQFKPSSEYRVHKLAYDLIKDAGFVIHTHQAYASAISLTGNEGLKLREEEIIQLGGLAFADYALPGTKKLARKAASAFKSGAETVLLARHGALIAGKDKGEVFNRALLLEEICKKACKGQPKETLAEEDLQSIREDADYYIGELKKTYNHLDYTASPPVLACAEEGDIIRAQLDDMAQMIGSKLKVVPKTLESVSNALGKKEAVLVPGIGAICRADTEEDCRALCLLVEKACISRLHTKALGRNNHLTWLDKRIMRRIYVKKYAKIKNRQ